MSSANSRFKWGRKANYIISVEQYRETRTLLCEFSSCLLLSDQIMFEDSLRSDFCVTTRASIDVANVIIVVERVFL